MIKSQRVIDWNNHAGNKNGEISGILEVTMLQEELNELEAAFLSEDFVEQVDACIDLIYVAIGTMHKLGLNSSDIENCFHEVCMSNNSKLPFTKDENGKVGKSENYFKPDLKKFLDKFLEK